MSCFSMVLDNPKPGYLPDDYWPDDYWPDDETPYPVTDGIDRLAMFGRDEEPATHSYFQVVDGRGKEECVRGLPMLSEAIPPRTSLWEMCQEYPNHVSGSMLLVFDNAGWKTSDIWSSLPDRFKEADPLYQVQLRHQQKTHRQQTPDAYLGRMVKQQKFRYLENNREQMASQQSSLFSTTGSNNGGRW